MFNYLANLLLLAVHHFILVDSWCVYAWLCIYVLNCIAAAAAILLYYLAVSHGHSAKLGGLPILQDQ